MSVRVPALGRAELEGGVEDLADGMRVRMTCACEAAGAWVIPGLRTASEWAA